jgi:hypothetical protein
MAALLMRLPVTSPAKSIARGTARTQPDSSTYGRLSGFFNSIINYYWPSSGRLARHSTTQLLLILFGHSGESERLPAIAQLLEQSRASVNRLRAGTIRPSSRKDLDRNTPNPEGL